MSTKYLPETTILTILHDVTLGLKELHERGIVHLDIKPENILESFKGNFKIADLGLARLLTAISPENEIPEGDSRYLAKELLNQDPTHPIPDLRKADVFALGMTIFEIIEGYESNYNRDDWLDIREGRVGFSLESINRYS